MNAEEFTRQVRMSVIDENVSIYRDLYENTENATDPYWQRALDLYKSLDIRQKEVFFEVIRQTAIDTVSNVFAVVDGVAKLNGQDGDCSLTCGTDSISGELQDHFLEHCDG
jgi:hypothetical protein